MSIKRVLIANRGEIAIRVARAAKDHGLIPIAVYSHGDRNAQHVLACNEAYSLDGTTASESYLNIEKIIAAAKAARADAVHPGYGFLSENATFAQAVIDAGLIWIGPPPRAISALGDKVSARKIAAKVGAPLVAGTADPVENSAEVVAFAKEHGLPVAIKVARTLEEIPELFDSAVREAVAAFGRGECFVERFLDRPRHVETQVLADAHGNVVVVSTRDCSLQRRHQKLVEEAPAPFLSAEQVKELYASSKAIIKEAGYVGAGTCEFLVGVDGTISFLEVNTRLQVEHPVSEEVTGLDLVREQFRIAAGERLAFDDPEIRGHSIEFRINGEDPGKNFLPTPGVITAWRTPSGPGVRVDAGFTSGDVISGNFDSLLAKLIVTGATRTEALERARRALDEFQVEGIATALPFHRAVVKDAAFISEPFKVFTGWIESEFQNDIPAFDQPSESLQESVMERLIVEVDGHRLEVGVLSNTPKRRRSNATRTFKNQGNALTSPMQGTVVKLAVANGDQVKEGELIAVLEAMKMEQPLLAHKDGEISGLNLTVGASISSGTQICQIL